MKILEFVEKPIRFEYERPSEAMIEALRERSASAMFEERPGLLLDQTYFKMKLDGASPETWTRLAVKDRVIEANRMLEEQGLGILIFDAFRSKRTQKAIFMEIYNVVRRTQPEWTHEQAWEETRKYAAHPEETSRFPIPTHNSGGAIDLAIHRDGQLLDFGGAFDDPSIISSTDYYERPYAEISGMTEARWSEVRRNRRLLFFLMKWFGFTNYRDEWWHYDLGDCLWSQELGIPWVFESMELPGEMPGN